MSSESNKTPIKKAIGAYVPPAKRIKSEKLEVGSDEYQRNQWDENKNKIMGYINRANKSNVSIIVKELFKCNLIRYKGLFASSLLKAQESASIYTDVYAALLAVINSRIGSIGILLVNRLILQYRLAFLNDNKSKCIASVRFIAHLTNQEVIHEALAFQVIDHLINNPTPASIEIVITFIKECGAKLDELNKSYLFEVIQLLRNLSLEKNLDTRTEEMIHSLHSIRKDGFKNYPAIAPELDLVEEDDKVTHVIELSQPKRDDFQMQLNYFKVDPKWSENEAKYDDLKKNLLDEDGSDSEYVTDTENSDGSDDEEETDDKKDIKPVIDATGANLETFRRDVHLTIKSSIRHEEVVHKLITFRRKLMFQVEDFEHQLCTMIMDSCGISNTYEAIHGLVSSTLCQKYRKSYAPEFEKLFQMFYENVHRFETNKVRNIAKFYSHLLVTDSIDWSCLECLRLRVNETSSPGRCFIKFLFQELVSIISLPTLINYIKDPNREAAFKEIFPRDKEEDIRFAISFFEACNLGKLTVDLRQELISRQEQEDDKKPLS